MVRAKFKCMKIEKQDVGYDGNVKEMQTVTLSPMYSTDPESENKKFWDATPQGQVQLGCINLEAAKFFELGKYYYLDFSEAPTK